MSTFTCTLDKKGRGRGLGLSRPWATRTVTVTGQKLAYFEGSKKKGELEISNCKVYVLKPVDADGKPFPFVIDMPAEKLILNAGDANLRNKFMAVCIAASRTANWQPLLASNEIQSQVNMLLNEQKAYEQLVEKTQKIQVVNALTGFAAKKQMKECLAKGDRDGARNAAAVMVQGFFRSAVAKKRVVQLKKKIAAIKIQCAFRTKKARKAFQHKLWYVAASQTSALRIQRVFRGRRVADTVFHLLNSQLHAVKVHLKRANDLAIGDFTSSDPYCYVSGFMPRDENPSTKGDAASRAATCEMTSLFKSNVVTRNLNPTWNQDCLVTGVNYHGYVVVTVVDKDKTGKDDFLGQAVIALKDYPYLYKKRTVEVTVPLHKHVVPIKVDNEPAFDIKNINVKGTITLTLTVPNRAYTMFGEICKLTETMLSSAFKRRWFVLVDGNLHYFGDRFQLHAVKHTIQCRDVTGIEKDSYKGEDVVKIATKSSDGNWLIKWEDEDSVEYRAAWNRKLYRNSPALEDPVLKKLGVLTKKYAKAK